MSPSQKNKRIDAHQHFWQYNAIEHAWMTDEMAVIRRDFLPPDLKPLLHRLGFDGCVAVQVRAESGGDALAAGGGGAA